MNNLVGDVKATPWDFYQYSNSKKKDTQGKMRNGSGVAQSEFEKADEFNGQFTDVFIKTEHNQAPLLDRLLLRTKEGVTKLVKKI